MCFCFFLEDFISLSCFAIMLNTTKTWYCVLPSGCESTQTRRAEEEREDG